MGSKESLSDTAKVISRYVDVAMARLSDRKDIQELAEHATIPIINALDDYAHPCQVCVVTLHSALVCFCSAMFSLLSHTHFLFQQMLADMLTIQEYKGSLGGLKIAFAGDICNNVTYDIMRMGCIMGMEVRVAGPSGEGFDVEQSVIDECAALSAANGSPECYITEDVFEACKDADIVYCDSWMSYGISRSVLQPSFLIVAINNSMSRPLPTLPTSYGHVCVYFLLVCGARHPDNIFTVRKWMLELQSSCPFKSMTMLWLLLLLEAFS